MPGSGDDQDSGRASLSGQPADCAGGVRRDAEVWVSATAKDAVAYAAGLLGNLMNAEDVVQDCYCSLLERADHYDLALEGRRLLFRSITNACINYAKSRRRFFSLTDGDPPLAALRAGTSPEPQEIAIGNELEQAFAKGLLCLPIQQRAALYLGTTGLAPKEMAEILGIRPGHAAVLLHRARRAMAGYLAAHFHEERTS